ncbi:MAG TPA: DUF4349 domain-containing protein [Acidimicrobiales bacterium]|nr:DUF4349 domain-containing protein [Acidimicrobiales bacterium]
MRATRPRPLLPILVALGLLVALAAGCSSSGVDDASSSGDASERQSIADEAAPADGAGGDAAGGAVSGEAAPDLGVDPATAAASANRDVILTGSISVVVDDLDRAVARAGRIATANGGLVFGEQTSRTTDPGSLLTLKVRPDRFTAALDELGALGEEQDRNIGSEDVTSQVVDLDSRIATAEASVDRLRALILRAEDIDDIAILENELLNRETTLETLRGQRRSLGDQVALATITVTLPPAADSPDPPPADDDLPGFLDAFRGGWDALLAVGTVAGLVLAALVPWIPVALVVALGIHLLVRRSRRRRSEAAVTAGAGTARGPDEGSSGPAAGFPPPPPPARPTAPAPPAVPGGDVVTDPTDARTPVSADAGGSVSPEGQSLS